MQVRDLTGRDLAYGVQIEAGTTYEFLMTLCAYGTPEEHATYELGADWFDNVRTRISRQLRRGLDAVGPRAGKVWIKLVGLATVDPPTPAVPLFLERVEALPPEELRLLLLGAHVPAYQQTLPVGLLEKAADGDPAAASELVADPCYFGGEGRSVLGSLLGMSTGETRDIALSTMRGWYEEVFGQMEATVRPILERDARAKERLVVSMPPEQAIEAISGVQFLPQPGIRQVYLIPQLCTRPWVWLAEHDEARLYCYPVADESITGDPAGPPGRLVQLHKALGDERRMRMLQAIAASPATLQELADRFGLPKSTAHHHLAILRAAGLIRVTSDEERRYSLRPEVISEMSTKLTGYLEGGTP
jgi:DNA-binding transcriptional ArsR family regulator